MSWRIKYTSKWDGQEHTHINTNNQSDAEGWARNLSQDNNCKTVCEHVADGPYDRSGKITHVLSVGDKNK